MATRRDVLRYTAATVALTSCGRADAQTGGAHSHEAIPRRARGRFELYKVSLAYDNPEARKAHRFPVDPKQKEVSEEEKTIMGAP